MASTSITALRNILRNRIHALINIAGLSVGMTASIIILLFVWDDLQFDRFHENAERIYRVIRKVPAWNMSLALNPLPLAAALKNDLPEVEEAVSFTRSVKSFIRYGDKWSKEGPICYVDPAFFSVFSFEFTRGIADQAFAHSRSAVMTQKLAHKIFGSEDPIGKNIFIHSVGNVKVKALIKDPKRSHIFLGVVLPLSLYPRPEYVDNWDRSNFTTYIMLRKGVRQNEFQQKHVNFLDKIFGPEAKNRLYFQPLRHVFLQSDYAYDFMQAPYNVALHYILTLIAVSILAIACFNYVNIETARGAKRTTEVAVRKTFGGSRQHLVVQFLSESIVLSMLAFIIAIALVEIFLPAFNRWTEIKDLSLYDHDHRGLLIAMALSAIVTGGAAGSYPALLLASLKPIDALRHMKNGTPAQPLLRKILVTFQFFVSIALIISSLTILKQREFFISADPGYSPENIVFADIPDSMQGKYEDFKTVLLQHPDISGVTAARDLLTWEGPSTLVTDWDGKKGPDDFLIHYTKVDPDFIETMSIRLVAGRSFAADTSGGGIIVNQEAVKQMELIDPVGTRVSGWGLEGRIIGVVQDFNYNNLREKVAPMMMAVDRKQLRVAYIRISGDNPDQAIKFIDSAWKKFEPDYPFAHLFLSDALTKLYKLEEKVGELFLAASGLALLLSCMGLYGLTSFICEQKTKEIAIRKACGASSADIMRMMLMMFFKLAIIANLFAWLVSYAGLSKWLQMLAYRVELDLFPFFIAAMASILAIIIAVGIKTARHATARPAKALRYE